jgi:sulfatase maturation enzyme AslB (radical SAM superfamily)
VRPIPAQWASIPRLQICVSIDGLQPEHDARRTPATYDRILKHIAGHQITVHCTVTRQQTERDGYIETFIRTWSDNQNVKTIWVSLYTPQVGEQSDEMLRPEDRRRVVEELRRLRTQFPKLQMPNGLLNAYLTPPQSPDDCIFAKTTDCVSADLETRITPCQFGGTPDCANCGCMASAALKAVGRHKLPGGIAVEKIFWGSIRVGKTLRRLRGSGTPPTVSEPVADGQASQSA